MDGKKEDYHFYFSVYGFFDGDEIRFGIDNEVELPSGYIFDVTNEKWITAISKELIKLDDVMLVALINKISNVRLSPEEE